jgi:hypothetical protein
MDLGGWLRSLGLEQYEAAFRENAIDEKMLPRLTAEDLKDLGINLVGHRRLLLDAIAVLRAESTAKAPPPDTPPATDITAKDTAERRQVTVMFSDLGLDSTVCANRPRGPARDHFGLSEMCRRNGAPLRRLCGEIFGRRCPRLLWLSAGA